MKKIITIICVMISMIAQAQSYESPASNWNGPCLQDFLSDNCTTTHKSERWRIDCIGNTKGQGWYVIYWTEIKCGSNVLIIGGRSEKNYLDCTNSLNEPVYSIFADLDINHDDAEYWNKLQSVVGGGAYLGSEIFLAKESTCYANYTVVIGPQNCNLTTGEGSNTKTASVNKPAYAVGMRMPCDGGCCIAKAQLDANGGIVSASEIVTGNNALDCGEVIKEGDYIRMYAGDLCPNTTIDVLTRGVCMSSGCSFDLSGTYNPLQNKRAISYQGKNYNVVSLAPVPAEDKLYISYDGTLVNSEIVDLENKVVMKVNGGSREVDIKNLPSGIYFYRATNENKIPFQRKFLKK